MDDEARIRVTGIVMMGVVVLALIIFAFSLWMVEKGPPIAETNAQTRAFESVVTACKALPTSAQGSCLANVADANDKAREVAACDNLGGNNGQDCLEALSTGKPTTDRALALQACNIISADDQAVQTCIEIALRTGKVKS